MRSMDLDGDKAELVTEAWPREEEEASAGDNILFTIYQIIYVMNVLGICRDRGTSRIFVALFDYDPPTMSPNPEACDEELPFREGQLIKVRLVP